MNELMAVALLALTTTIIAGIGHTCYKVGYDSGRHDGEEFKELIRKAFEKEDA